jgi:hypothetical protein
MADRQSVYRGRPGIGKQVIGHPFTISACSARQRRLVCHSVWGERPGSLGRDPPSRAGNNAGIALPAH